MRYDGFWRIRIGHSVEIVEIVSFTPESGDPWLPCGSPRCHVTGI